MGNRQHGSRGLFSRDFLFLFFLLLFCNCSMAVYYCFEQWLNRVSVSPNWRGLLLGALFGLITLTRPIASVLLLGRRKFFLTFLSMLVICAVMPCYGLLQPQSAAFVWLVLGLRIVQGIALGIFSACTVAVMVDLFPPGQSARGFALFSLTILLPFAVMPTLGEALLPLLANHGAETGLFTLTGLLGLPALVMLFPLSPALNRPETLASGADGKKRGVGATLAAARHSGLGLVFLATLLVGLTTSTGIFFVKGLCTETGGNPALFFVIYTLTMIVVRVSGSNRLDILPKSRVIPPCAFLMGLSFLGMAWLPLWAYAPAAFVYGLNLSLVYPLCAGLICDRSTPETRGLNSNFMMLCFDVAALLSPMAGGLVISLGLGYRGIFTVGACFIFGCGLAILADALREQGRKY